MTRIVWTNASDCPDSGVIQVSQYSTKDGIELRDDGMRNTGVDRPTRWGLTYGRRFTQRCRDDLSFHRDVRIKRVAFGS